MPTQTRPAILLCPVEDKEQATHFEYVDDGVPRRRFEPVNCLSSVEPERRLLYRAKHVTNPQAMLDFFNLQDDLAAALNKHSVENQSNTPDFILAEYLVGCLQVLRTAINAREAWYGQSMGPGNGAGNG